MRVSLNALTDAGAHVLFDPAAIPDLIANPSPKEFEKVKAEAEKGNLIFYDAHGDGGAIFEIVLNEEANPQTLRYSMRKVEGFLRVPSGKLWACGQELLYIGSKEGQPESWKPKYAHMASEVQIEPGNFRVEACVIDTSEERQEIKISETLSAEEKNKVKRAVQVQNYGCLITIFLIIGLFCVQALPAGIHYLAVSSLCAAIAAVWVVGRRMKARIGAQEAFKKVSDIEAYFESLPSAVICLTPIAKDADLSDMAGVVLDEGGVERTRGE
ncbi:MAG: hypothetical protein L6R28_02965 [Planctomycetes bacterium]|nr:hypothetical protein [Planctomycetota bacterium]